MNGSKVVGKRVAELVNSAGRVAQKLEPQAGKMAADSLSLSTWFPKAFGVEGKSLALSLKGAGTSFQKDGAVALEAKLEGGSFLAKFVAWLKLDLTPLADGRVRARTRIEPEKVPALLRPIVDKLLADSNSGGESILMPVASDASKLAFLTQLEHKPFTISRLPNGVVSLDMPLSSLLLKPTV